MSFTPRKLLADRHHFHLHFLPLSPARSRTRFCIPLTPSTVIPSQTHKRCSGARSNPRYDRDAKTEHLYSGLLTPGTPSSNNDLRYHQTSWSSLCTFRAQENDPQKSARGQSTASSSVVRPLSHRSRGLLTSRPWRELYRYILSGPITRSLVPFSSAR
jgi:hypothetical protein